MTDAPKSHKVLALESLRAGLQMARQAPPSREVGYLMVDLTEAIKELEQVQELVRPRRKAEAPKKISDGKMKANLAVTARLPEGVAP